MKNILAIFNCHGLQYLRYLKLCSEFNNNYESNFIAIYTLETEEIINTKKSQLLNADIVILQYIKHEDKPYHHEKIRKLLKPDCEIILIPHYVFSGYWIPFKLGDDFNENKTDNELLQILDSLCNNKEQIIKNYNNSLDEFKKTEENCTIKMYDYVQKNAKNIRLFNSRGFYFILISIERNVI